MRTFRIAQLVVLTMVVGYGVAFHNANPRPLALPGLLSLPPSLVVFLVAVIAFLVGWLPATIRAWRRHREVSRLQRRISELEQHVPSYDRDVSSPVIPDRATISDPGEGPESARRSR